MMINNHDIVADFGETNVSNWNGDFDNLDEGSL